MIDLSDTDDRKKDIILKHRIGNYAKHLTLSQKQKIWALMKTFIEYNNIAG